MFGEDQSDDAITTLENDASGKRLDDIDNLLSDGPTKSQQDVDELMPPDPDGEEGLDSISALVEPQVEDSTNVDDIEALLANNAVGKLPAIEPEQAATAQEDMDALLSTNATE